jgi:hypothetical protein
MTEPQNRTEIPGSDVSCESLDCRRGLSCGSLLVNGAPITTGVTGGGTPPFFPVWQTPTVLGQSTCFDNGAWVSIEGDEVIVAPSIGSVSFAALSSNPSPGLANASFVQVGADGLITIQASDVDGVNKSIVITTPANAAPGGPSGVRIQDRVGGAIGFHNTTPIVKPTVTGSRGGNAALASLLTALANYGLIVNSSTA